MRSREGRPFEIVSSFAPCGDQPDAIRALAKGVVEGRSCQTLLGVTGSWKTFTVANVIEEVNRPTLLISHNKTLAAQLYSELRDIFPHNAVEYFVSYYDYYQPEAYIPSSDTYIEKDSSVNDEIDKLRQQLMDEQPFWGILASRLKTVVGNHFHGREVKTAAVDGRPLFINPDFWNDLSLQERKTIQSLQDKFKKL